MWTVVYIAPNQKVAEKLQQKLTSEGFLVKLRPIGLAQPGTVCSVEILVPESEVNEALEIINMG
ncbi:glutamate decarboxylase [Desulfolucanica intricata]|uniref:glutamate decarboxylase n=1 Tax=Desulfolucanica intricata TaxID=1285191 RepID=UPI000833CAEE|nr:glutamate decarboxylase [Desulfolucanica intricata]